METKETVESFFLRHGEIKRDTRQFGVYRIEEFGKAKSYPHGRKNFYKIMLLTQANGVIVYPDKTIAVTDGSLLFANPMVPYSWQGPTEGVTGYLCLFTEEFIDRGLKSEVFSQSVLFRPGGYPVLYPNSQTIGFLTSLFEQMLNEKEGNYINKEDLLRNYIQIFVHAALKISPSQEFYKQGTSSNRISNLFLTLLDRQFPIVTSSRVLKLKNASDYAVQLSVHTNHLNKALRETTGKTTTEHINGRVLIEAKALLARTSWSVAEVGYCLGFDHPSNFNGFFKKQTGQTPLIFRRNMDSIS